jgi:hypothetical protein
MEYYVFQTIEDANACISAINDSGWFPIVGNKNGRPAPESQQTTCWVKNAQEMNSGEWAVPRIPESRLDFMGIPQETRDAFLATYGQDIRELSSEDFPSEEET